ncbi:DUF4190 domain-containing protein [Cryobacterium sp. GrIS_2_6]|uniref:DUF4190 domain-containing protein n=1 Tax=Cryobacterium sp. GrIS_2_6 TaxID=3162785 RepID=UPI002E0704F6|nr:hypothetical protein [Cryobacterium psychrotolerans]
MTDSPPPVPRDSYNSPTFVPKIPPAWENVEASRRPFSKMAIWGFVLACIGLIVFGFVGALAATLSGRALRTIRQTGARGRGLAIAGMCIGLIDFVFYVMGRFYL